MACYANGGRERMRLLWVVGSRDAFGGWSTFRARTMRRKRRPPPWLPVVSLLAQAAGLATTAGRAGSFFAVAGPARRRRGERQAGPGKIQWLSMRVLQLLRARQGLASVVGADGARPMEEMDGLEDRGVFGPADALDYIVATHHRLFGPRIRRRPTPTATAMCGMQGAGSAAGAGGRVPQHRNPERTGSRASRLNRRAGERPPAFWRGRQCWREPR